MTTLPSSLFYIIGIMIISNLGALGALIVFIFKCGQFVANTETGISDAKDTAVRAHKRIDELAKINNEQGGIYD